MPGIRKPVGYRRGVRDTTINISSILNEALAHSGGIRTEVPNTIGLQRDTVKVS